MTAYTINNWMTWNPVTITPTTTLVAAHRTLKRQNIRHLPVVAAAQLVSLITVHDLRRAELEVLACYKGDEIAPLASQLKTVGEIMPPAPPTVTPDMHVAAAARLMLENKITALPVVVGDKLVGILTDSDIFRVVMQLQKG